MPNIKIPVVTISTFSSSPAYFNILMSQQRSADNLLIEQNESKRTCWTVFFISEFNSFVLSVLGRLTIS